MHANNITAKLMERTDCDITQGVTRVSRRPQRMAPGRGFSCEVNSWCPIEIDSLPLGRRRALMAKAEDYTVFVKNSIAFPYFGEQYMRNNLISNGRRPCLYT